MKPDYTNSIVNLMSSIVSTGDISSPYNPLQTESLNDLDDVENIILLMIDGLGYNYLKKHGSGMYLQRHLKTSITSVFPPSTGSAMTSIYTGLAPQQHTCVGWWVYLKEFGLVSRILPYSNAIDYNVLGESISYIIDVDPLPSQMNRDFTVVLKDSIVDSQFTKHVNHNARRYGFSGDFDALSTCIRDAVALNDRKKYILGYWDRLDEYSHLLGPSSVEAKKHLNNIDARIKGFTESLDGTNSILIISSDHGFIDVPRQNSIITGDHPELMDCLILPLCGDTRSVFCYVRPNRTEKFEYYVQNTFGEICELYRSDDLINQEWFGLFEPNPKLSGRVGDYTLMFKEHYAFLNSYPGRESSQLLGHHGGVTQDEMLVPLIVIDC